MTGMIPAITGLSTPSLREALDQLEIVRGVEEELRDREVGLAQLLGRVPTVRLEALGTRMRLRVRGDPDREVAELAERAARDRSRG